MGLGSFFKRDKKTDIRRKKKTSYQSIKANAWTQNVINAFQFVQAVSSFQMMA